MTSLELRVEI